MLGGTHVLFASHCGYDNLDVRRRLRERQCGISCLAVTGRNTGTAADCESCTSTDCNTRASPGRATRASTGRATCPSTGCATRASTGRAACPSTGRAACPSTGRAACPSTGRTSVSVTIPRGAERLGDRAYIPDQVEVAVGATVTWMNTDAVAHTSTSDASGFDSGIVPPGGQFSFAFQREGTFRYHCAIHPGMVGTVVVR